MLHLTTPKISFQVVLKNANDEFYNESKENDEFYAELVIHLTMQSRGAPEGKFNGVPKETLSDIHKDAREGACQVALKGALEVSLRLRCTKKCN